MSAATGIRSIERLSGAGSLIGEHTVRGLIETLAG